MSMSTCIAQTHFHVDSNMLVTPDKDDALKGGGEGVGNEGSGLWVKGHGEGYDGRGMRGGNRGGRPDEGGAGR